MTPRQVEFLESARAELQAATAWYSERDATLAHKFVSEVERTVDLLAQHPGIGPPWNDPDLIQPVRRVPLRKFPYLLVYVEIGMTIEIVAVAHTKRRPGYWKPRLPQ